MVDERLRKLQAASGVLFAGFLSVHLANTWLAAFGPSAYDGLQSLGRQVYQWLPVEIVLLTAVAVHMVVGVARIVREPKRHLNLRARMHRYSGFFLLLVITGHVLAVRGPSWFFGIYPGFQGLAFTVDYLPGVFYPYYFVLGLAGFYHGCNGLGIALQRLAPSGPLRPLSGRALAAVSALAGIAMIGALLGLGGVLFQLSDVYRSEFAALVLDVLGQEATSVAQQP